MAKGKNTVAIVTELSQPVADQMGLQLWDVRFEKEGSVWYLRILIDKEDGVDLVDCENFSRTVDKLLDEADPISQSYVLEVGSPGIERELVKDWHFRQYPGAVVRVRLIRPLEGKKDWVGELAAYGEDGAVTLALPDGGEQHFARADMAFVKLYDDYDMGGLDA